LTVSAGMSSPKLPSVAASVTDNRQLQFLLNGGNMETMNAILNRRTTRSFKDIPIPDDLLQNIISAGLHAPSNDHLRKWEFVIISDRTRRMQIIDKINKNMTKKDAEKYAAGKGLKNIEQRKMYIEAIPLQYKMLLTAGALVLPFFCQEKPLLKPAKLSSLNYFASVWCCIENMLIAASNYDIQGVVRIPFTGEIVHIKEQLNVPADYEFPCYLALGYPEDEKPSFSRVNQDIKKHIHMNSW